ncbi:putative carboxylesterase 18 [Hibiscus syriacus]|uniref:Carboxylesterase 18 n=1 Tax=Hibiscus syriacus TaxID=106335 RepID=A0A6A3C3P1_HIBSY|nr:probable carboxylesterase 18 [Hibiscus syriacus]KAE8723404.1 putative carboxylesterase 18 [Hibiscus syriacus]
MSSANKPMPKLPLKVRFLIAAHSMTVAAFSRPDGSAVNRRLMNLFDPKASPATKPDNGVVSSDIMVDTTRKLWFRLYTTTSGDQMDIPIIVYFHGGGFAYMAANSMNYDDLCKRLAREIPAVVVSVNYRLSPEHRFPSQYVDGFDVLKFIDSSDIEGFPAFGTSKKPFFVAGDSAGGNLAHHVALKACQHEFSRLKLRGVIALQPFFGGEERTESELKLVGVPFISVKRTDWMWKAFLPHGCDRDHQVVNVFGPNSVDISELPFPPTLVVIGGFDPLQDWQKKYVEGLNKCGKQVYSVEYPDAFHGFYAFPELPESPLLMAELNTFVHNQLT